MGGPVATRGAKAQARMTVRKAGAEITVVETRLQPRSQRSKRMQQDDSRRRAFHPRDQSA